LQIDRILMNIHIHIENIRVR